MALRERSEWRPPRAGSCFAKTFWAIAVLLCGMEAPPNFGARYTSEFRQAFRDLADEHDVVFLPFFLDGVAGNAALNQADGIHPNAEGHQRIARHVLPFLKAHLQPQPATTP